MQKTAYEMRISDWSSDVCSSDLDADDADFGHLVVRQNAVESDLVLRAFEHVDRADEVSGGNGEGNVGLALVSPDVLDDHVDVDPLRGERAKDVGDAARTAGAAGDDALPFLLVVGVAGDVLRSEE